MEFIVIILLAIAPMFFIAMVDKEEQKNNPPKPKINDDLPPGYCRIDRQKCLHPEPEFDNCRFCKKWDEYKYKMDLWDL